MDRIKYSIQVLPHSDSRRELRDTHIKIQLHFQVPSGVCQTYLEQSTYNEQLSYEQAISRLVLFYCFEMIL